MTAIEVPCPHCGGDNVFFFALDEHTGQASECANCGELLSHEEIFKPLFVSARGTSPEKVN